MRGGYGDWCASQSCHTHASWGVPLCCEALRQRMVLWMTGTVMSSKDSTDENPPQNLDVDEDEPLEPATDVSIPGDIQMTWSPWLFPQRKTTYCR